MIDRTLKLSPHFTLGELIPEDCDFVPAEVLVNLEVLASEVLEPIRAYFGRPILIHSGYRPPKHNAAVGGVLSSDHPAGRAADFHVTGNDDITWQTSTLSAFVWIRENLKGRFGQVILEDHRKRLKKPGKLWVHVSTPSVRHPGANDVNAVLLSSAPGEYTALA